MQALYCGTVSFQVTGFGWCTDDVSGVGAHLEIEGGGGLLKSSISIPLPDPYDARRPTELVMEWGLTLALEWGQREIDGIQATTLKVSLGDEYFVAVRCPGKSWMYRPIETHEGADKYFVRYRPDNRWRD